MTSSPTALLLRIATDDPAAFYEDLEILSDDSDEVASRLDTFCPEVEVTEDLIIEVRAAAETALLDDPYDPQDAS